MARIERGTKEREVITRINGKEGVELAIFKEGDANTVQVARCGKEQAGSNSEEPSLGSSGKNRISAMDIMFDQSKFIQDSINEVRDNAIIGGLLAIFILFFFLKEFRSTVIIGLSIPISIIATFFVMYQLGIKLNIMSLGGLALGVGMLVDDAIVVLESIVRHYKEGKPLAKLRMMEQRKSASQLPQVLLPQLLYSFRFLLLKELRVRCSGIWRSQ